MCTHRCTQYTESLINKILPDQWLVIAAYEYNQLVFNLSSLFLSNLSLFKVVYCMKYMSISV